MKLKVDLDLTCRVSLGLLEDKQSDESATQATRRLVTLPHHQISCAGCHETASAEKRKKGRASSYPAATEHRFVEPRFLVTRQIRWQHVPTHSVIQYLTTLSGCPQIVPKTYEKNAILCIAICSCVSKIQQFV